MSNMDPFVELKVLTETISVFLLPVIILVGLIGNVFSLLVFMKTYLSRLSLSIYMVTLSVSDSMFLITLFVMWLEYLDIRAFHQHGMCQLVIYVSYCSAFLSAWCVVSFSVERFIAICLPLRRPEMCTSSRATKVVTVLGMLSLVIYSPSLWASGITLVRGQYQMCTPYMDGYAGTVTVLLYMDTLLTFILPFISIVVLNSIIIHRIAYFYRNRQKCQSGNSLVMLEPNSNSSGTLLNTNIICDSYHPQTNLGLRAQIKLTKSIIVISTVYLVINLPSYIIRLKVFIVNVFNKQYEGSAHDFVIQQLSQFLYYMNFAINFFLYSVCSGKFRDAFRRFWWQFKYNMSRYVERSYRLFRRNTTYYDTDPNVITSPNYVRPHRMGTKIHL